VIVLGEDIAALLGLCLALVFISLAAISGNPIFDAIGSMCIGVVLIVISVFLTLRVQSLLVGRSADPLIREAIDKVIRENDDIEQVFNTITMQMGPYTMLAAKIKLRSGIDIDTAVDDINALEIRLKEEIPNLKWCFIEPDVID
jgi:divalent metal cation (Fe/Co/Zn/Cd) transporter